MAKVVLHLIHAIGRCQCGDYINIRARFRKGQVWSHHEKCWNCTRDMELRGRTCYCEGVKVSTQLVSEETKTVEE